MAHAFVASYTNFNAAVAATVVAGELVVVTVDYSNITAPGAIVDGLGNSYSLINTVVNSFNGSQSAVYQAKISVGGAASIVVSGWTPTAPVYMVARWTGLNTCSNGTAQASQYQPAVTLAADNLSSTTLTPSAQPGLLVGFASNPGSLAVAAGTGFTARTSGLPVAGRPMMIEELSIAALTAIAATFTAGQTNQSAVHAAYFPDTGTVGPRPTGFIKYMLGALSALSAVTLPPLSAPAFTSAVIVTSAGVGNPVTWTPGTVTGNPTPTRSYVIFLNGVSKGSAYTPVSADIGATIIVQDTATNASGTASSSSAGMVVVGSVPAAPTNLYATPVGSYLVNVGCDPGTNSPTKYHFEYSAAGANVWTDDPTTPQSIVLNSRHIYFPSSPSTSFDFRMRIENSVGLGAYSNILTVSTLARLPLTNAPAVASYGWTGDDLTTEDPATAIAYNAATAYQTGNVITSGGTAYMAVTETTANAPPNATYWRPITGTVYYISAAGSDANNGTSSATPWQTLEKLKTVITSPFASTYAPNNSLVLFRRGDTFDNVLYIQSTNSNYMFGSYGSALAMPRIKWNTAQAWQNRSSVLAVLSSQPIIRHIAFEYGTANVAGTNTVQTYNNTNPLSMHSCEIRGAVAYGIRSDTSVGLNIKNCWIVLNKVLGVGGIDWTSHQFLNNTFDTNGTDKTFDHQLYIDTASRITIRGNNFLNGNGNYAIVMHGPCSETIVDQNRFTANNNGIGISNGYIPTVSNEWAKEMFAGMQITRNIIESCGQGAGQTQGFGIITDSLVDTYIANNTFRNNKVQDISLAVSTDASDVLTNNVDIAFNSFIQASAADPSVHIYNGAMTSIRVRDNAFYMSSSGGNAIGVDVAVAANQITLSNNQYFPAAGTTNLISWRGTNYGSVTAFQAAVPAQDVGSQQGDPLFTNLTGNFALQAGSPCKLKGTTITNLTIDLPGTTRSATTPSIGAYE